MSMQKFLKEFFDATVQKNEDAAKIAFDNYVNAKTVSLIKESEDAKSPIKLKGDDVYVNGKKVGCIFHDIDKDEKIGYTSTEGKKKSFDKLPDLYAHLSKEHKLTETTAETVEESVKDFETEIQAMDPRLAFKKLKAFTDAPGEGLDADGDHDGPEDAKVCDEKRQKPLKDLIKKIKDGGRETTVEG